MGVPSGCSTSEACGHAFTQSLHFVQRSRNSASSAAPGGRSQSVRMAGAGFSGAASACAAYSFAAFATDRTESLKKSRLPYFGSVATVFAVSHPEQMLKTDCSTHPTPARRDGLSLRAAAESAEARSSRYVEALNDARTTLAGVFSICCYITPSARSLYTSTQRSQAPNSTSHPG